MKYLEDSWDNYVKNLKQDWDITIAVTGTKRKGKSTCTHHACEYIRPRLNSKIWLCYSYAPKDEEDEESPDELRKQLGIPDDYIMPSTLRTAMLESGQNDQIFCDESVEFLQSGMWNTPDARDFISLHDEFGYKNLLIWLLMPSFKSLQKGFREDRLKSHYWIRYRGKVWVYPARETREGIYFPPEDMPLFRDSFPQLDELKEQRYRAIKLALLAKQTQTYPGMNLRSYRKFVLKNIINTFPEVEQETLGTILGISQGRVSQILKDMRIY